jgi:DNA-binding GntR family transcriptional regulator
MTRRRPRAKPRPVAPAAVAAPAAIRKMPAAASQQFSRPFWLANILRERIVGGVWQPGTRIREADLQQEFGFSNGPIREALQMVVADGLAERTPWQGVRVVAHDEKQIVELFEVRLALLEYAAELAARRAPEDALAAAPAIKQAMDQGFVEIAAGGGHPAFHGKLSQWLLGATGNAKLQRVWDATMLQTLIYVNASLRKSAGAKTKGLIHDLIDAITARDATAARKAARELTRQTLLDLGINGIV